LSPKPLKSEIFGEWVRRHAHLLLATGLVSATAWVGSWFLALMWPFLFPKEGGGDERESGLLHWLGQTIEWRKAEFVFLGRIALGLLLGIGLGLLAIRFARRFGFTFGKGARSVPLFDLACFTGTTILFFLCSTFFPLSLLLGNWVGLVRWMLAGPLPPILSGIAFLCLLLWALTLTSGGGNRLFRLPSQLLFGTKSIHFLLAGMLFVFGITNLFSYALFDHMPHVHDGVVQLFQAKILALGHVTVKSPSFAKFFHLKYIFSSGRWHTQYPMGHALALLPGILIGAPWLINPLLGTLSLATTYFASKKFFGRENEARVGLILMATSPFFLFISSEYMNHATAMFLFSLFLLGFAGMAEERSWKWGALGGLALGAMFHVRPLTAAALGLPFCLYYIGLFLVAPAKRLPAGLAFVAAFAVPAAALLWYNQATNGDPFLFGYTAMWGSSGFGLGESQWGPPHTTARGMINTCNALGLLNLYLFEWPIPSLFFLFLLFAFPFRKTHWDWLFLISTLLVIVAYFFYFFSNTLMGPRFYYSALPMVVLLTARGIEALSEGLSKAGIATVATARSRLILAVCGCLLFALLIRYPYWINYYQASFMGVDRKGWEAVQAAGIDRGLVFVRIHRRDRLEASLVALGISCRDVETLLAGGNLEFIDRLLAKAASLRYDGFTDQELAAYLRTASLQDFSDGISRIYYGLNLADFSPFEKGDNLPRRKDITRVHTDITGINYTALHFFNSPSLDTPLLFPIDMGPENETLMRAFPNRPYYRLSVDEFGDYQLAPLAPPGSDMDRNREL